MTFELGAFLVAVGFFTGAIFMGALALHLQHRRRRALRRYQEIL